MSKIIGVSFVFLCSFVYSKLVIYWIFGNLSNGNVYSFCIAVLLTMLIVSTGILIRRQYCYKKAIESELDKINTMYKIYVGGCLESVLRYVANLPDIQNGSDLSFQIGRATQGLIDVLNKPNCSRSEWNEALGVFNCNEFSVPSSLQEKLIRLIDLYEYPAESYLYYFFDFRVSLDIFASKGSIPEDLSLVLDKIVDLKTELSKREKEIYKEIRSLKK